MLCFACGDTSEGNVYSYDDGDMPNSAYNPPNNSYIPPDNSDNPPDNSDNPPDNSDNPPDNNGNLPDNEPAPNLPALAPAVNPAYAVAGVENEFVVDSQAGYALTFYQASCQVNVVQVEPLVFTTDDSLGATECTLWLTYSRNGQDFEEELTFELI
jgi:hypothetical protein